MSPHDDDGEATEIDFTADDIGRLEVEPSWEGYGIASRRAGKEATRKTLAYALVGLFALVCVASLAALIAGFIEVDELKSLLEILIPPIVALTGSVVGFYFGVERGEQD